MNKLINNASVIGKYNNIATSLVSNTVEINMLDELKMIKEANKKTWRDGYLTYIITIDNQSTSTYQNSKITIVPNNNLISFVDNSIKINDIPVSHNDYHYEANTHTLTIDIPNITKNAKTIITYSIKKKYLDFFILRSTCILTYSNEIKLNSNIVTVISPIRKKYQKSLDCSTPYWRY